jgi:hypothetical protein
MIPFEYLYYAIYEATHFNIDVGTQGVNLSTMAKWSGSRLNYEGPVLFLQRCVRIFHQLWPASSHDARLAGCDFDGIEELVEGASSWKVNVALSCEAKQSSIIF